MWYHTGCSSEVRSLTRFRAFQDDSQCQRTFSKHRTSDSPCPSTSYCIKAACRTILLLEECLDPPTRCQDVVFQRNLTLLETNRNVKEVFAVPTPFHDTQLLNCHGEHPLNHHCIVLFAAVHTRYENPGERLHSLVLVRQEKSPPKCRPRFGLAKLSLFLWSSVMRQPCLR